MGPKLLGVVETVHERLEPGRSREEHVGRREGHDGEQEAELIRLACSEAPDGRSQWSLHLLSDRMVELGFVEDLSHETVRQTLRTNRSKTNSSLTGADNV